jgi:hypothetical protein
MGLVTGGTATLGATSPSTTWYFAEGYTGTGFDQYITIQNPDGATTATITYYVEGTGAQTCQVALPANSRTTVTTHADASAGNPCGIGRGKANAFKVEAGSQVVVERPMYFLYNGSPGTTSIDGGHNLMGVTSLTSVGQTVILTEGYTGNGFNEYLTFQNPNGVDVSVTITYLRSNGTTVVRSGVILPANQRKTVAVHNAADPAGLGPNEEFSVKVTVNSGGSVLVERVMYFRYNSTATGGSAATGVPF